MSNDMDVKETPPAGKKPFLNLDEQGKRKVTMWVAVGGIVACVVTVWLLLFPLQMQKAKTGGISGWLFNGNTPVDGKTFSETWHEAADAFDQNFGDLKKQIDAEVAKEAAPENSAALDKLRARIEEAAAKRTAAPVNAAVNSPAAPATTPVSGSTIKK